jgi:O-antigen/teichoic acid export membrane protein
MQWRLAAGGIVTYFAYSLFNPVMFHYYGAIVAGQMGMTLQMVNGLQTVAMAWVSTKVPRFGMLIARKEYVTLDKFWLRASLVSLGAVSSGAVMLWLIVYGLNMLKMELSQRMLAPLPTGLFLLAAIFMQISQCLVVYLRAHKQEPILLPSVIMNVVSGLLVWLMGSRFGPLGAAAGYFSQLIISSIWVGTIWWRCRAEWHKS